MSRPTTAALIPIPAAAAGVTVTTGASGGLFGAWVTLSASLASASQLAGAGVLTPGGSIELEIGIGGAGSEVALAHLFLYNENPANSGLNIVMLPVPVDGLTSGARLAARARIASGSAATVTLTVLCYAGLGASDHVAASSTPYTYLPYGGVGVSLTPSATPWANSAWGQVTASLGTECALVGVAINPTVANTQWEVDLGTGAASAETVITTLRGEIGALQGVTNQWLPAAFPVAAGTRIAVRLRKSDTSTSAIAVTVPYLESTALLAAPAVTRAQAYVWGPI